jgi:hypothetical protein
LSDSRAVVAGNGDVTVHLSLAARTLGIYSGRSMRVAAGEVAGIWRSDALTVGRQLRWKIAGTALSRQRAMGWFSWIGHRGRWAWVWLTPGRKVAVIETRRARPALLVVPLDWFDAESAGRVPQTEWSAW